MPDSVASSPNHPRHWVWISGWGISPEVFREAIQARWPSDRHTVFPPGPNAVDDALNAKPDILIGYSLGSLLLMSSPKLPSHPAIFGLAPILAFDQEAQQGGKTRRRTRLALEKKAAYDPLSAIHLYLRLVGLSHWAPTALPYSLPDLSWGLSALGQLQVRSENLSKIHLLVGEEDPLTEAQKLSNLCPKITLIPNQAHDLRHLLPTLHDLIITAAS